MDATHDELLQLLATGGQCRELATLVPLLNELIAHTERHFQTEELWMVQSKFPHLIEHRSEHRQLLAEMQLMQRRLRPATVPLVRSFITERLPDWLQLHLQRMDSLLAAHLNTPE
jgi:hemerythrin-like metal-binding protein